MFLFHWRVSKGSIIVSYQLVLKEKYTLADLTAIMKNYLQVHGGKLGLFEVKADSIDFSGKLIWNMHVIGNYVAYTFP